ncbi:MAG: arsenate reductase ArsC [Verrucomicrobiia bacterium]
MSRPASPKTMSQNQESPKFNLLFLCTGNSARSVMGEYLLRRIAPTRFNSYSAGASPKGEVHPMTLRVLKEFFKIDASDARSKSWEEFKDGNPVFDFVITVCDNARESCPIWPGQPIIAHWGSPDPAAFVGSDEETFRFFKNVAIQIQRRLELFTSLPLEKLDRLRLTEVTKEIGSKENTVSNN